MTEEPPPGEPAGRTRAAVGWFWRLFAAFVVAFRIPILVGWIAAAALATIYLPALSASGSLGGLVSGNSPAVRAEIEASRRPLRSAVATAAPRASRTITVAALALAAGFAALALVPLAQFRELAVAMVLGVLIDALVVRSVLVPAFVVLFGDVGRWPAGRRARLAHPEAAVRERSAAPTDEKPAA